MALDTGMKCIKYLLFIFNLLFVVSGCVLIILGAVIQHIYSSYFNFLVPKLSMASPPLILLGVGVVIFVVGFFGCCGAYKENCCMVYTFAFLLMIVLVVQVSAGVAAYIMVAELKEIVRENFRESMNNYNESNHNIYKTWNVIQHDYMCCGTDGYQDWSATAYGDLVNGVPDDCCIESVRNCGANIFSNPDQLKTIYKDGCFDKLDGDLRNNVTVLGGVAVGIGFVQLVGVAFACCLGKSLRRQYVTV